MTTTSSSPAESTDIAVTPDATAAARTYLPNPGRTGVALCLSGGGTRAALFHLGVVRRLNELGILSQINTVTSVSGGSILAAHLAAQLTDWPSPGLPLPRVKEDVAPAFEDFARRNLRTPPLARRLLPWNWLRDQTQVDWLAHLFERYLNGTRLADLPTAGPRYVFCASDNAFAVNWIFTRDEIGDYQAGYGAPGTWTVGRAAAASSCFPPVFDPMKLNLRPADLTRGDFPSGEQRNALVRGLRLSDGGLYDNLALEPVWKSHRVVIVSDGGGTFDPMPDAGLLKRLKRYATVMGRQATSIRKRWLIAGFATGAMHGVYMGIGTPVSRYEVGGEGYSESLVRDSIAQTRTDLDRFTDAEIAVLQNHGYLVADAAVRAHLGKAGISVLGHVPPDPPYRNWLNERAVAEAMADSYKVKLPFGRGSWLRDML